MDTSRFQRWCGAMVLCLGCTVVNAQESAFTYQGRLTEQGAPAEGLYGLEFRLYNSATEGLQLGEAQQIEPVTVAEGLFTVWLDFGPEVGGAGERWLEMAVRTNEAAADFETLTPRQRITSSPRATSALEAERSNLAQTVADASVGAESIVPGSLLATNLAPGQVVRTLNGLTDEVTIEGNGLVTVETVGSSVRVGSQAWGLAGNSETSPAQDFLGTTDSTPLELRVNDQRVMRFEAFTNGLQVNVLGGYLGNRIGSGAMGATVAGGGGAYGPGEGWVQQIDSHYGALGGGVANQIGTDSAYSTISGGFSNRISADAGESTIGGGSLNEVDTGAYRSAIDGGYQNIVGSGAYFSSIGGGFTNVVQAHISVIAGGSENFIEPGARFSTIGGGGGNRVGVNSFTGTIAGGGTQAIGSDSRRATIGGGKSNLIGNQSPHTVIGGGLENVIGDAAEGAVIPGGISNRVESAHALAAGYQAQALHAGSLVWADASGPAFRSVTANEAALRVTGGMRVVSAIDAEGVPTAGVELSAGSGSWATLSDRAAKTDFSPVDPEEVLRRVDRLEIETWRYQAEGPGLRHMGPTAQEFHQAFGLGANNRTITTVDADGAALAAIQGLYRMVREQQREIEVLRARLDAVAGAAPETATPSGND